MEKTIYTQAEYDAEMHVINTAMQNALRPLNEQLHQLNNKRTEIKQGILALKSELCELGSASYEICKVIEETKSEYNNKKRQLYLKRPETNSN